MNGTTLVIALVVTVLLLSCTIWTGVRAKRRAHYPFAVATVLALAFAIVQARIYGEVFDIPRLRLQVHLSLAFTSLSLLPCAVITGILLIRKASVRRWHRFFTWSFVVVTVIAMVAALWMLAGATPKESLA
ncbi:MAG: hypothetical protein MK209_03365 [Planctomycetes bacterium]|nr:hypothetical protein [Planctomycetota bacterium]